MQCMKINKLRFKYFTIYKQFSDYTFLTNKYLYNLMLYFEHYSLKKHFTGDTTSPIRVQLVSKFYLIGNNTLRNHPFAKKQSLKNAQ
jgi:hypothetical protein